tara:strand:+ start:310 stop:573 length:264 start_codon:yes stop_codon:yes gene_type:complete
VSIAVDTSTASIIAVLFTAPSKLILSDGFDVLKLNADDLMAGLPDFPKVFRAEWLDTIFLLFKDVFNTYGLYNKFKGILKVFNPFAY